MAQARQSAERTVIVDLEIRVRTYGHPDKAADEGVRFAARALATQFGDRLEVRDPLTGVWRRYDAGGNAGEVVDHAIANGDGP